MTLDDAALDALLDRIAASLQRDSLQSGDAMALCATASTLYAAVFLGALRAGLAVAPLVTGLLPETFQRMLNDSGALRLFANARVPADGIALPVTSLDDLDAWLMPPRPSLFADRF